MTDYRVTLESGWVVRDVDTLDDAIGIAISEAGKRLNPPRAKFVEIEIGQAICPFCEEELNNALIVANIALVGLTLEMKVFKQSRKPMRNASQSPLSERHCVTFR